MKTKSLIILSFIGLFSISIFSCKKVKELLRFNIKINTSQTIKATPLLASFFSSMANAKSSDAQEFSTQGTRTDLVKEAKLNSAKLVITSPQGQNFDFLELIEVYIQNQDGSNSKKIAFKDSIPDNVGNTLELDVDNSLFLDSYIKADNFKLETKYKVKKAVTQDVNMDINMVVSVVADPI